MSEEAVAPVPEVHPLRTRRPWGAVLLGFSVPGLGQLYAGEGKRAIVVFAALWPLGMFFFFAIHQPSFGLAATSFGVLIVATIAYVIDAYRCAKRAASPFALRRYNRWYVYVGLIGINAALLSPERIASALFGESKTFKIPTSSMAPALEPGDFLFATDLPPGPLPPRSIAIYRSPNRGEALMKRAVGLPGDTLKMISGVLEIDGAKVSESYLDDGDDCQGSAPDSARRNWGPVIVPAGYYFMLGDNRDCSYDSRDYGPIARDRIFARPLFIYFSHRGAEILWDRIGQPIR